MYAFVEAEKVHYPVALLYRVLRLSQSAFYASRNRVVTKTQRQDVRLREQIASVFKTHRSRYGRPRIANALRQDGVAIGANRVRRLMNELGLQAKTRAHHVRMSRKRSEPQSSET